MTQFAPIRDKMERAYRNKERLHLDADQVERLVRSPIWPMIAELTATEIAESWQDDRDEAALPPATTTAPARSSGHSGSGIAPSVMTGASAGTLTAKMDEAVEQAERARVWEVVDRRTSRRKKR